MWHQLGFPSFSLLVKCNIGEGLVAYFQKNWWVGEIPLHELVSSFISYLPLKHLFCGFCSFVP